MKHDQSAFAAAAYGKQDIVADRVRRFVPMVRKAAWHTARGRAYTCRWVRWRRSSIWQSASAMMAITQAAGFLPKAAPW